MNASGGSSKIFEPSKLAGQRLERLTSWGKHFIMIFERCNVRVHFMMFGSYRIDEERPGMTPRLSLIFSNGEMSFYACSIRELSEPVESLYDARSDIMSPLWDEKLALSKLESCPATQACDALLDQAIFGGVGNIIKNEVLFRVRFRPETRVGRLSDKERLLLVREARRYSMQFYHWKKRYELRKNWQVYRRRACPVCETKIRMANTGKLKRRSFYCPNCQKAPSGPPGSAARGALLKRALAIAATEARRLSRAMGTGQHAHPVEREH